MNNYGYCHFCQGECEYPSPSADTPSAHITPAVWPPPHPLGHVMGSLTLHNPTMWKPPFPSGRRNYAWTPHEWPNRNYIRLPDNPTKPAA